MSFEKKVEKHYVALTVSIILLLIGLIGFIICGTSYPEAPSQYQVPYGIGAVVSLMVLVFFLYSAAYIIEHNKKN